jgi:hypothetical protein
MDWKALLQISYTGRCQGGTFDIRAASILMVHLMVGGEALLFVFVHRFLNFVLSPQ